MKEDSTKDETKEGEKQMKCTNCGKKMEDCKC